MHMVLHALLTYLMQLLCASGKKHTCFGLSVKEIQGRIAFHVLAIWYILEKGVKDKATLIKEIFYDLELEEE